MITMKQIKLFENKCLAGLEHDMNNWLKENNVNTIDIKTNIETVVLPYSDYTQDADPITRYSTVSNYTGRIVYEVEE